MTGDLSMKASTKALISATEDVPPNPSCTFKLTKSLYANSSTGVGATLSNSDFYS